MLKDAGLVFGKNFAMPEQGPWLIGRDFNVTRFFGERTGLEIHISGMRGFNDLM